MSQNTLAIRPSILESVGIAAQAAAAPRFDMYAGIHKALRGLMGNVLFQVGRIDCDDPQERVATLGAARALLDACRSHLHHENQFVHAAMEARRPGSSRLRAGEHDEHLREIAVLESMISAVELAPPPARPAAALRLYRALALFVAGNFEHMHEEETVHNAVLWDAYTDEELIEIHDALVASIPPEEMAQTGRALLPALTPAERAAMVSGMQMGMPAEALAGLLASVRPVISDRDWAKLEAATGPLPRG